MIPWDDTVPRAKCGNPNSEFTIGWFALSHQYPGRIRPHPRKKNLPYMYNFNEAWTRKR